MGGQRTLQKRWTTFAKAQLLCQADQELPYNILQDIVTLPPPEGASEDETLFYGIFSSQWWESMLQIITLIVLFIYLFIFHILN